MAGKSIGDRELALLQHLSERGELTVAEAVEEFGAAHGLARSTVLTMMERLRAKRYLKRRPVDGVYRYQATRAPGEVLRGTVSSFVERTLGGSVTPFVAYLAERGEVSDQELEELETAVERLRERREETS
jgi:predicted transcriptional regulator